MKTEYRLFYKKLLLKFTILEENNELKKLKAEIYNRQDKTFYDFEDGLYWYEQPYYKLLSEQEVLIWIANNQI